MMQENARLLENEPKGDTENEETISIMEKSEDIDSNVDYFSFQNFGLFIHAVLVGLVSNDYSGGIQYALFLIYLDQTGKFNSVASALLYIPGSIKVLFAAVNDSMPILGYRRKPYMILGWIGNFIVCAIVVLAPFPKSRYVIENRNATNNCSYLYHSKINSPEHRGTELEYTLYSFLYLAAMLSMTTFTTITGTAMDGLMVQYARKENESQRGKIQSFVYAMRTIGSTTNLLVTAIGFNWYVYAGPWCYGITVQTFYMINAIASIIAIPIVIFMTSEDPVKTSPKFTNIVDKIWFALQSKAMQRILLFSFLMNTAQSLASPADSMIMKYWAQTDNFTLNMSNVLGQILMFVGTSIFGMFLRNYNWRITIGLTQIFITGINATVTLITIFKVIRNQYFYVSDSITQQVFFGINSICSMLIAVEMADSQIEGIVYGVIMSFINLGNNVGAVVGILVALPFSVSNSKRYHNDTDKDRVMIAIQEIIIYFLQIGLTFLVLPLFPTGIQTTQKLKRKLSFSRSWAIFTVIAFLVIMFSSITYSIVAPFL